ncbi:hypothetical protein J2S41_002244 [Catenuloplanes atrovinosus]|uniref:Uncharacterized protein n=1 Tax=Catenuloplanes atrovinosus TaxID=137266 RepID=A0AAE3YPF7_9ACTN|nr:hypothetical protein [Catenuloplanes atrovinosus]
MVSWSRCLSLSTTIWLLRFKANGPAAQQPGRSSIYVMGVDGRGVHGHVVASSPRSAPFRRRLGRMWQTVHEPGNLRKAEFFSPRDGYAVLAGVVRANDLLARRTWRPGRSACSLCGGPGASAGSSLGRRPARPSTRGVTGRTARDIGNAVAFAGLVGHCKGGGPGGSLRAVTGRGER